MILLKILGIIDILGALAMLFALFGINVFYIYFLFCAILLLVKSLFLITGDVLSVIDMVSSLVLFLSIFFSLPGFILWLLFFLLVSKGIISFV